MMLALLAGPATAAGQTGAWRIDAGLSSQLVDRGIAISPRTPMLQGSVSWTSSGNWSAGLSAGAPLKSPGQTSEIMAQVARSWRLSDDLQTLASAIYYDYRGLDGATSYRRLEMDLSWIYRDLLVFNLSEAHAVGRTSAPWLGAAELNLHFPLAGHLALVTGVGLAQYPYYSHYHADNRGVYGYGNAGLAWDRGNFHAELTRVATGGLPSQRRGTGGLAPWLGSMRWTF
jgi:hypothetical protein